MRRGEAAFLLALLAAVPAAAQQPRLYEAPEDLPEGEGREEAFYQCSACHGFNLVARQGMSRDFWEDTWDLMVERHGMFDPGPQAREAIVSYLTETFPPRAEPGGWKNPFMGN
jgi:mono/diheme cytochrome c family protein